MKTKDSKASPEQLTAALKALTAALPERVCTDDKSRFRASVDNLRLSFLPDVVIQVRAAEEVGRVLQIANEYEVPVTVRGAGSSATGSAVPLRGGWVLDASARRTARRHRR